MIRFTLKCSEGHQFESWFQSASAYEALKSAGHVDCAVCGSGDVEKAIMAPQVSTARKAEARASVVHGEMAESKARESGALSTPSNPQERALAELRRNIEANSDYVGMEFAREARAMHVGDAPERAIHGEARIEDAKKLIEDGVPVTPLPFRPGRKTN